MWILKEESGKFHYIVPCRPFTIGRNQGDLVLKCDGSLSRAHAKIEVFPTGECQVTDTKSKYGTFVLDETSEVVPKTIKDIYIVKPNDRIRFGLQNCILTFTQQNFIVSTTSLNPAHRKELLEILNKVGGTILKEWSNSCTHLTVTTTKLTAKLSCSLAAALPVVTIDYWRSVRTAVSKGESMPDPKNFCPSLEDSMLVKKNETSLLPMLSRRTVFKDCLFVYFRMNQLMTYQKMIELSGGMSVFYGDKNFDKKLLYHPNSRLILYTDDDSQDEPYKVPTTEAVKSLLKERKRRMIPETEIPLAILYSSIESWCNPDFSYGSLFKGGRERRSMEEGETLIADTQDLIVGKEMVKVRKGFVPESLVILESFGDGDSSGLRRGKKRSAGSIGKDSTDDPESDRKRSRGSKDRDTGRRDKEDGLQSLSETHKKLSRKIGLCLKSVKSPAEEGVLDDLEARPVEKSKDWGKILGKNQANSWNGNEEGMPGDRTSSGRKNERLDREIIKSKGVADNFDGELDIRSVKNGIVREKLFGKSSLDHHGEIELADDNIITRSNKKSDNSDDDDKKSAIVKKHKKPSKFLEVSNQEIKIIGPVELEEIDGHETDWRRGLNETSRERLIKSFLGDEKSMQKSLLRPAVFSGEFIGKRFKKFHQKIVKRPAIEWKRGL